MAAGARPIVVDEEREPSTVPDSDASDGGRVSREVFTREIDRRADDPNLAFFCVLDVSSGALSPSELEDSLAELVRSEEGDIVSRGPQRCVVLLQGAREGQLGPFLSRLRSRLAPAGEGDDPDLEVNVLSHPTDSYRIQELLVDGD
jgi:hypothetical protein